MARVRIATFNVENLFARFMFKANQDPQVAVAQGWRSDQTKFTVYDEDSKHITGALLNEVNADLLCLQEVEDLDVLKRFRTDYLGGRRNYPYGVVIDGNDPRRIDVAVLSRLPILAARTWQHLPYGSGYIFSRDCLEVDIDMPDGSVLTVYNNHFKSMIGGRGATKAKRVRQSKAVREIVQSRFGTNAGQGGNQLVICGDFNDYRGAGSGLTALTEWSQVQDVVRRLPSDAEWTHYWNGGDEYRQLDYLLMSDSLANAHAGVKPIIWRYGLPWRASRYDGRRYEGVGPSKPKASDHCPVSFDLDF
jgi:endonuclease/exonuclease/phosphatase family metal-dependent hydrolase